MLATCCNPEFEWIIFSQAQKRRFEQIKMVEWPFILISEFQFSLRHGSTFFARGQIITHPFGKNEPMKPMKPSITIFSDVYGWLGSSTCGILITAWREVCWYPTLPLDTFQNLPNSEDDASWGIFFFPSILLSLGWHLQLINLLEQKLSCCMEPMHLSKVLPTWQLRSTWSIPATCKEVP